MRSNVIKYLINSSWFLTGMILTIGFMLLHLELIGYGISFFILFPFFLGFAVGTLDKNGRIWSSLIVGVIAFLGTLLTLGLEGLFCVLMAFPLFGVSVLLGHFVRSKLIKKSKPDQQIKISFIPLLGLILMDNVEQHLAPKHQLEEIESSVVLPYDAVEVFHMVKQMDTLNADKPIALKIGLPTPYKCILYGDTVGSLRVCKFQNGEIIAKIKAYKPGESLEMEVIDYTLTGREWFHFEEASYDFERNGDSTKITRKSSYSSVLRPRFYWKPLEIWGIEQEHRFVLMSLYKNLKEANEKDHPSWRNRIPGAVAE